MSEYTIQQLNVYEYLGKEYDPLFNAISNMRQGYPEYIPDLKVTVKKIGMVFTKWPLNQTMNAIQIKKSYTVVSVRF